MENIGMFNNLENGRYTLTLYVNGTTPNSVAAVVNVRRLCEEHLADRYDLEVLDISRFPAKAKKAQLIGLPALVKHTPLPVRHFLGDMSQTQILLKKLDILL